MNAPGGPDPSSRRGSPFTIALLIALAITALWWQLAERRARHAVRDAEAANRRTAAVADSVRRATIDSLRKVPRY